MLYSNVARVGLTGVWLKECRIKREALLGAAVRRDEVHGSTMRRVHPTRRLRAARSAQIGAVQPENRPRPRSTMLACDICQLDDRRYSRIFWG